MMVLVTYDVNTTTAEGRRRLRQVARCCTAHGQRVQNSVFECSLDEAQFVQMKTQLAEIMDAGKDSLRFYNLGNRYRSRVLHLGTRTVCDPNDTLIL